MSNSFGYFQQQWIHNHHEKPIPVMTHSCGTEFFPYIQMELFLSNPFALCIPVLHLLYQPSVKHLKTVTRLPAAFSSQGKKNPIPSAFFSSIFSKYFGCLLLNPLWNWGSKDGTQYSRCGLTRAWKRIMENLLICFLGSCWHSPRQSLPSLYQGFQLHICSDGDSCGLEAIRKAFMGVYLGFTDN